MSCLWNPKHKVTSKTSDRHSCFCHCALPAPWAPLFLALVFQAAQEDWSQCCSDSPQGTADAGRGFSKTRQSGSGKEDAVVQGHWVTAEKQLLVPRLGWCQSPFLSLFIFLKLPTARVSSLSSQGWAQLSSHHGITTPLVKFIFPTCSAQGGCLVRMPWSLPGARSCAGTSPSTLPTTPAGQTNSPGTHPCRTGNSARLKGPQRNFGGEFKLCCKGEDRPERFLLQQGQAQRRRLELMDSAITEMLGEALGRLLFLRPARAEPSPSPRHSSRKHRSPEPFESFRLQRAHSPDEPGLSAPRSLIRAENSRSA